MTLTILLLLSSLLAFPQGRGRIAARNYRPITAEWNGTKWVCSNNLRLPPNADFPPPQKDKPAPPCISPPPQPPRPRFDNSEPHGVWSAPQSHVEWAYMEVTGHLVWKHYKVSFMPLPGRIPYDRVENMTHRLPYYFDHDPKNLVLTKTSFEFDAVAGDDIAWYVWSR